MIHFRIATLIPAMSLTALLAVAVPAHPAVPSTMSYQGFLTDGGGVSVADGSYALTFRLYDVATDGAPLWTETQGSIPVADGLFSVVLGSTTPLAIPFDRPYWLGISVGADPELLPRTSLTSAPYALATRTPIPGIASTHYPGSFSIVGNANAGSPIQLYKDVTLDFTAPADGYVVVSATGYLTMTLVAAGTSQYGVLQLAETTGNATSFVNAEAGYYQWIGFQFAPNNGYWDWTFGLERVFAVTAGDHAYSFCSARFGAFSPTFESVTNLSLIATYYPATNYGGVVTAPAGMPQATGAHPEPGSR